MPGRKPSPLANPADQRKSRLMGLPAELRNRIYHYVFEGSSMTIPRRKKPNLKGLLKAPGLLVSCKQAHAEAIMIYYSTVKFCVHNNYREGSITRLPQFLKTIGQEKVNLIHTICATSSYPIGGLLFSHYITNSAGEAIRTIEEVKQKIEKAGKKITVQEGVVIAYVEYVHVKGYHAYVCTSEPSKVAEELLADPEVRK